MFKILLFLAMAVPSFTAQPAAAQEQQRRINGAQAQERGTRLDLARQVHEFRSVNKQVTDALNLLAEDLPIGERQIFIDSVLANIDMEGLEIASVNAMAEIFTADELQTMIQYYSDPHSPGIEAKSMIYRRRTDPQIVSAINQSLQQIESALAAEAARIAPAAGR